MIDIFGIFKNLIDNGVTVLGNEIQFGYRNEVKNETTFALKPSVLRDVNTVSNENYVIYLSYTDVINTPVTDLYKDELYPMSLIVTNFNVESTEDVSGELIKIINEIEYLTYWYNQDMAREVIFDPIGINRLQGASEFNINVSARRLGVNPLE